LGCLATRGCTGTYRYLAGEEADAVAVLELLLVVVKGGERSGLV
jgi:hypothetical protein